MTTRFASLPLNEDALQDYHIQARRQWRPALLGPHITRRMGESQEFREHTYYQLGDDVRHIDWRASARMHGRLGLSDSQNWLVRRYAAEEHYRFVISLDLRCTMDYPVAAKRRRSRNATVDDLSKHQVARWIATTLSWLALYSGDQATLHPLFGPSGTSISLRGSPSVAVIESILDGFNANPHDEAALNLDDLEELLRPAAVWIILTDLYFREDVGLRLAERLRSAVTGRRWLILVDLDSWLFESTVLETGPRLIGGPIPGSKRVFVTQDQLQDVERRIEAHRRVFTTAAGGGVDVTEWKWWTASELTGTDALALFFKRTFHSDRKLRRLFERDPWS